MKKIKKIKIKLNGKFTTINENLSLSIFLKLSILNNLIMAKIQLNGRKIIVESEYSILQLLKKYKINSKKIAVELNAKIINKNKYSITFLKDKDKVEVVHFIGGG